MLSSSLCGIVGRRLFPLPPLLSLTCYNINTVIHTGSHETPAIAPHLDPPAFDRSLSSQLRDLKFRRNSSFLPAACDTSIERATTGCTGVVCITS